MHLLKLSGRRAGIGAIGLALLMAAPAATAAHPNAVEAPSPDERSGPAVGAGAAPAIQRVPGPNLWPNPSLTNDLDQDAVPDGWQATGTATDMTKVEPNQPTSQSTALCITDDRADAYAAWMSAPVTVVEPRHTYTLSWAQQVDFSSMSLTVSFFDESGEPVGEGASIPLASSRGTWGTDSTSFAAPPEAIKMRIRVASTADGTGSGCLSQWDLRRTPSDPPPDIWYNGGFENEAGGGPAGWRKAGNAEESGQLSWSEDDVASGERSLCVHRTDPSTDAAGAYWLSDAVPVEGGTSYNLDFQQYFKDVAHQPAPSWGFDMTVAAQFLDADGQLQMTETKMAVTGSSDGWEDFTRQLQAPEAATQVRLKVGSDPHAQGTLCVDDVTLSGPLPGSHPFVSQFTRVPRNFEVPDWAAISKDYVTTALSGESLGEYGPLFRPYDVGEWAADIPNYRGTYFGESFSIPSYVGEPDLRKEAVTDIGTLYSATLNGIDVSDYRGKDLVAQMEVYNSVITADDGTEKGLIFNNPNFDGRCGGWYTLYPTIQYGQLLEQYPAETYQHMREQFVEAARSWIAGIPAMQARDWNVWCYNFQADRGMTYEEAFGVRANAKQPDLALGIAWVSYLAWEQTGDPEFRDAAVTAMTDMAARTTGSPNYEVFGFFAPALAAEMNADLGTDLPVEKFFDWVFTNGFSRDTRPDYGMIADTWGDYDAHGLMGGTGLWGGYAFGMETNVGVSAVAPVARYQPHLAKDLGAWALQVANNLKIAYPKYTPPKNQSDADFIKRTGVTSIPYEGVKHYYEGEAPYATSDIRFWLPTSKGWTDFAPYSAWSTGLLGALASETNVRGVLQLDLLKTDTNPDDAYPTYSYYNPNATTANLKVEVGTEPVDLYDAVTHSFVAEGAAGRARFNLDSQASRVLVRVPADAEVEIEGGKLLADGVVIDYNYPSIG